MSDVERASAHSARNAFAAAVIASATATAIMAVFGAAVLAPLIGVVSFGVLYRAILAYREYREGAA